MPHMSSDQLRDISVSVVEGFINHKVPLSEGLAKQAALHELNSEQIQRCVEASNTIAHLKLLEVAEDRTFEFPLCKFAEVMQHAAAPDLEKSASATNVGAAGYIGAKHAQNKMQEKRASDESMPEISEHEAKLHFIKEAAANARIVEDLEARSEVLHAALLKTASEIANDELGLDKIACAADAENVPALTSLVYGEARQVRDFGAGRDGLFKAAELKPVATLQGLYKEARALVAELQHRKELHKRASAMTAELQKEALLASVGRSVGRGIGWTAGKAAATGVKATSGAVKATFGAAKNAIGGVPGKGLGLGAAGLTAGVTLGMNASMLGHDPGYNKVTGQSKDVWNALQN